MSARADEPAFVSINLTTGEMREVPAEGYRAPLAYCNALRVAEVIFWSKRTEMWIVLVETHTARVMPKGMREVAESELDYYAAALGG